MDEPIQRGAERDGRDGPAVVPHRRPPVVMIVLLFFALVLVIDGVAGERGWLANRRARQQHEDASRALDAQRLENARSREQARRLRTDPAAWEELARRELGLIKPGEKVFIIRDMKKPAK